MALNLLRFFKDESCGQCTPCRVGCEKAVKLMERDLWDEVLLEEPFRHGGRLHLRPWPGGSIRSARS